MKGEAAPLLAALRSIADGSFFEQSGYTALLPADYAEAELTRLGYVRVWREDRSEWVWRKGRRSC